MGSKGHFAPLGHYLTQQPDENHKKILEKLNWTCTQCGNAQYGVDGTCCGLEAKDHLIERIKEFSAIATKQRPGSRDLNSGKVKDFAFILNKILSPHG